MGNPKGFIEIHKKEAGNRPVNERTMDFAEVEQTLNTHDRQLQASRCMDCGVPFCHWGCPVDSKIPEWQDAVYKGDWKLAVNLLQSTNDFPEFTGRVCPALCEKSCVLAIYNKAVTIRENEASIMEHAFEMNIIKANPPKIRSGKKVAVIGSGPSGLTVAARLNRLGHTITIFEKDEKPGGILRFGIPDFKLNKGIIDRRIKIFEEEGIVFKTNTFIGIDGTPEKILKDYDVVCLAIGAMQARDLTVPGRELSGVHLAMDFLTLQNRMVAGMEIPENERISAKGKDVIVIGGGDTGSDCIGTAIRQKAKSIKQIEILPQPPEQRTENNPWPYWPKTLKTTSSHQEGCERYWSLETKKLIGKNGKLSQIQLNQLEWDQDNSGNWNKKIISDKPIIFKTELVLLAMGFTQPVHQGLLEQLNLKFDNKGNIKVNENSQINNSKIFAAGDAATGASLVVRAIKSGQIAAEHINQYLNSI